MKDQLKRLVAWEVLKYIQLNQIIGVGTGSTITYFIEALSSIKENIKGAVSSSEYSSEQLKKIGIALYNLNNLDQLDIYIDSADEIDVNMQMIKGAGGGVGGGGGGDGSVREAQCEQLHWVVAGVGDRSAPG